MQIGKMDKYLTKMEPLLLDALSLVTPEGDTTSEDFRSSYLGILRIMRLELAHQRSSEAMEYLDEVLLMAMKDSAQCVKSIEFVDKLMKSDIEVKAKILELLGK